MNEVASTLQARQEITEGIYRYCRSLDRMDRELMSTVFHPSGTVQYPKFQGTWMEFVDWVWDLHRAFESHSHQIGERHHSLQRRWIVGRLGVLCDRHAVEGCERFKDGDPGRRTGWRRWRSSADQGNEGRSLGPLSGQVVAGRRRLGNRSPGVCRRHQDRDGGGRSRRGRPTRPGRPVVCPAGRDPGVRSFAHKEPRDDGRSPSRFNDTKRRGALPHVRADGLDEGSGRSSHRRHQDGRVRRHLLLAPRSRGDRSGAGDGVATD